VKETDHCENRSVDNKIILKCILKEDGGCGLDSSAQIRDRDRYEHSNQPSVPVKYRDFLTS
jgi:hypothetical protein